MFPALLASILSAAAADCPPVSAAQLATEMRAAEAHVLAGAVPQFQSAVDALVLSIPCVDHIVAPSAAARLHRLVGLRASTLRQDERALQAFASARSIEPDAPLMPDGSAPGNTLAVLYTGMDPATAGRVRPELPPGVELFVDGLATAEHPALRPFVAQWSLTGGASSGPVAGTSAYVGVGGDALAIPPEVLGPPAASGIRRAPLFWSAIGLATTAVGLQVGAQVVHRRVYAGAIDDTERAQATVNGLTLSSAGLGVVSAGLGATWAFGGGR